MSTKAMGVPPVSELTEHGAETISNMQNDVNSLKAQLKSAEEVRDCLLLLHMNCFYLLLFSVYAPAYIYMKMHILFHAITYQILMAVQLPIIELITAIL